MKSPLATTLALFLLAPSTHASRPTRTIIDTHVHNALLGLGLNYEYPATFPDLAHRNWTLEEYSSSLPDGVESEVVLMELAKSGDRWTQSLEEAAAYQAVADECDRTGNCFVSCVNISIRKSNYGANANMKGRRDRGFGARHERSCRDLRVSAQAAEGRTTRPWYP